MLLRSTELQASTGAMQATVCSALPFRRMYDPTAQLARLFFLITHTLLYMSPNACPCEQKTLQQHPHSHHLLPAGHPGVDGRRLQRAGAMAPTLGRRLLTKSAGCRQQLPRLRRLAGVLPATEDTHRQAGKGPNHTHRLRPWRRRQPP
jgi:hypothetical protein